MHSVGSGCALEHAERAVVKGLHVQLGLQIQHVRIIRPMGRHFAEQRKRQGFEYIELDNPDAYEIDDVIGAIDLARSYGLKVIAKNPGLMERAASKYVAHPNVFGIIVEKGAGNAADMDGLRRKAGKPDIPVWFVAFGSGRNWANSVAKAASNYRNMGVTYSTEGEYRNAQEVLVPASADRSAKI